MNSISKFAFAMFVMGSVSASADSKILTRLEQLPSLKINCLLTDAGPGQTRQAQIRFKGTGKGYTTDYFVVDVVHGKEIVEDAYATVSKDLKTVMVANASLMGSEVTPSLYARLQTNPLLRDIGYTGYVSTTGTGSGIPRSNAACAWVTKK